MNNFAIARVFDRIADLLEIQGENPFKIRAYRNAALTIRELTESLDGLAGRDALETVPGIGAAIAEKTRDILATGTCPLYEELKREVPETLIELLALPGFGPRKVQAVWRELGVRDLDSLEAAAREERLRTLPGFGARSEAKVLPAIEGHRRRSERIPIRVALPYAEALRDSLLESGAFIRLELAGSLRRRRDTVGDLDLVGVASNRVAAMEALTTHPETEGILERGESKTRVKTRSGLRTDLRLARESEFGALWVHFTGSAAHNIRLRRLAAERGARLSEYGAFDEPTDAALGTWPDEAEVYRFLGMPWIPPELREDRGEMEAALAGALPRLVEGDSIRGILHAHSSWSDGAASIEQMAATARSLGYEYHGNTDHSRALGVARGLDEERLRAQMAEIDALNRGYEDGFRILKGIECDILADGELDLPLELLEELDLVVASVHTHQGLDEEAMTRRIIRALESGVVDILGHPTGRLLGIRDAYAVDMHRVMDAAKANRVALEINASGYRLDLNDVLAREARDRGIPLALNTDAHRVEHLGLLRLGLGQARRAWVRPEDLLNTWPLDRLMAWLRDRTA